MKKGNKSEKERSGNMTGKSKIENEYWRREDQNQIKTGYSKILGMKLNAICN